MANRTIKEAISVKGTNPQYLVEKIIRTRIYDSKYWKEECFALTAELMVDKAMELRYIGGIFGGNVKPTPFLSLTLKMLQIQPEKDIVVEFIKNEDFKYVRALGAFYMRLVGTSVEIYKYLEPLYNDYRKIRIQNKDGNFELLYMDDFIDNILRSERYCDVILPRLQKRKVLEEANELEPRISALEENLEECSESDEDGERCNGSLSPPSSISRANQSGRDKKKELSRPDREQVRERVRSKERYRERQRDRSRSWDLSRKREGNSSRERDRSRNRERSRDRDQRRRHRGRSSERSRDYRKEPERRIRDQEKDRKAHSKTRRVCKTERDHRKNEEQGKLRKKSNYTSTNPEIVEANALRFKLGIAPLRH
nr:EOG090X0DXI [Megafenestra aurita]